MKVIHAGETLMEIRKHLKISQVEVALQLSVRLKQNIHQSRISHLENNRNFPNVLVLSALLDIYGTYIGIRLYDWETFSETDTDITGKEKLHNPNQLSFL